MQRVGDGEAQRTQGGVAGGDGQHDDADEGDHAADVAEDVTADDADSGGRLRGDGFLKAEVVYAHCARGPDHCDEALKHHHVVEGGAAFALALHGAGDYRRLRGVEAREYAAGHRDEEHGDEVPVVEVLGIVEHAVVVPGALPQVYEGIALCEHADEHADGGEEQDRAEDGVDAADYRVNGEHGRAEVVGENNAVDNPRGDRGGRAGEVEHLRRGDVAGGVDEHRAHKQKQQADKDVVNDIDALVGVLLDHIGHLRAAVAQADHAGEVVVHRAADDVAYRDGDECDGSEQNALNGSEYGPGPGNVQQVDKAVLPAFHGNVVHAVLLGVGRSLAVVGSEDLLTELAVEECAREKNNKADNEC